MNQPDNWKMTPLDALLCTNQLQILKTLVFFLHPARQRQMILLIKFMELRQCITLPLSRLSSFSHTVDRSEPGTDFFEQIFPYCDREHQQTLRQMQNAFQMMKTVRQFSDSGLFDNLSEMMGGPGGFSGMDAFAQMAGTQGMNAFAQMAGARGMDAFTQTAGPNTESASRSGDDQTTPSSAPPENDQLGSMLSSMMNPEQQALFKEYEAMLDDL